MCCARTAALQDGYEKQKVNASRDFLQQSLHHVQKSIESCAKNTFCSCVRHVRKFIKHRKNCVVLVDEEHFRDACLLTPKHIVKCGFEGSKTCPRPPKIESGATQSSNQNDQHEQKKCKKRSRTSQEWKKVAQEWKMCQHGPNLKHFGLDFGGSWDFLASPKQGKAIC